MKIIKNTFMIIVSLVVILLIIGLFLPTTYHIERSIVIQASPNFIFPHLNSFRTWPEWTAWTPERDPTVKYDYAGPEAGIGAKYMWNGQELGNGHITIVESQENTRIRYDLWMENDKYHAEDMMQLVQTADGTRVIWTDEGELGHNPFLRYLGLLMDRFIGPDFEEGLAKLKARAEQDARDYETLTAWMTGSFSSAEQAVADSDYYDIRLEMVPIWQERTDGYWLYVEQAVATYKDRPYRQRVYQVTQSTPGTYISYIYTLPDPPLRFAGAYQHETPLATLTPDSLTLREGCEVILQKQDVETFAGATGKKTCTSELRGASYATSEVILTKEALISWDRGYDSEGNQVWGAEKGGYIFKRVTPTE
ncbi:MAG: hypothetical protein D6675_08180 [Gemmatimonadetes bacterium]|nr:MAG: hypothetical protein D6675_08180 [Gemmatimonadota bacterium]